MSIEYLPPAELRRRAHEAIERELGPVALVRYLRDCSPGAGDYTCDRQRNLPDGPVEELFRKLQETEKQQSGEGG